MKNTETFKRALVTLHGALLLFLYGRMCLQALLIFRCYDHDYLSYHLPEALRLVGLTSYLGRDEVENTVSGYPPLAHFVQGALVWVTGRISAANSLNAFGFLVFLGALFTAFRGLVAGFQWRWFLTALLAIPHFSIHFTSGYIDLWAAYGVTLMLAGLFLFSKSESRAWFLVVIGSAWAVYSKATTWAPILILTLAFTIIVLRHTKKPISRVLPLGLLVLITLSWPLRNLVVLGNPAHPWETPYVRSVVVKLHELFPRVIPPSAEWKLSSVALASTPEYLKNRSNSFRFFSSAFELSRLQPFEPMPWNLGQDAIDTSSPHFRQGGWFWLTSLILVAFSAGVIVLGAGTPRMIGFLLAVLIFQSSTMPQSHELRYWIFIPICLVLYLFFYQSVLPKGAQRVLLLSLGLAAAWVVPKTVVFGGIHPTSPPDCAPPAARTYWKTCPPASGIRQTICTLDPFMLYWAGPTFSECAVKGCLISCKNKCDIDYRTDPAAMNEDRAPRVDLEKTAAFDGN